MYSWLKKVSALLLAAAVLLTFSAGVAATVQYETITAPRVRDGGVRELGSVLIRMQPLLDIEHVAWVSLPSGFNIEEVSVLQAEYNGTLLDFKIDGIPGPAPVTAEPDADSFLLSIPAQGEISEEVLIILSFDRVDVPENFRGDIVVRFEGLEGQFTSGTATSALVPSRPVEEPEEEEPEPEPEEPEPEPEPEDPEPPVEVPETREVLLVVGSRIAHVNGQRLQLDVTPFIQDDRTFVPVRFVAEAFDAEADWTPRDAAAEVVTLSKDDMLVTMNIGSPIIHVRENAADRTVTADVAPQIVEDRTFLPLRAVGEIFGAEFDWGPKDELTQWVRFSMDL